MLGWGWGDGEAYILIRMYWCSLSKKSLLRDVPTKHSSWWRRLEDVFRLHLQKTSWSRPIHSSWPYVFKTSSGRLAITRGLAKMSSRHLQDVLKTSSRCLQDLLQRYFQDVFKTYHQIKLFLLISLRDVSNTFLRRTAKRVIYRRIFLGHTSQKFIVSVQNLEEW